MNFLFRAAFVLGGIFVGTHLLNYYVLGNSGDYLPSGPRMGEWKEAAVREKCYPALEHPERDDMLPKPTTEKHRIDFRELTKAREMTAALNCYLVTQPNAVCERHNRAYIVNYIGRYFLQFDEMMNTAKRYGEPEMATVKSLWDSPRNRAINSALMQNASNGRLIKADFGWSVPAAMKPMLERYNGTTDNCSKA